MRRLAPDPTVELNPETAARYGVQDRDWVWLETPRARVRADVTDAIAVGVACANHGWWEACEELGLAAMDPSTDDGANINLLVENDRPDPVSGSVPHRSSLCLVRPIAEA